MSMSRNAPWPGSGGGGRRPRRVSHASPRMTSRGPYIGVRMAKRQYFTSADGILQHAHGPGSLLAGLECVRYAGVVVAHRHQAAEGSSQVKTPTEGNREGAKRAIRSGKP